MAIHTALFYWCTEYIVFVCTVFVHTVTTVRIQLSLSQAQIQDLNPIETQYFQNSRMTHGKLY